MKSPTSNPYVVIFALWLMVFSASSQVILISPIIPNIATELGEDESRLGWLVSAYAILLGIFALMTGPISDKFGRRKVLLAGCSTMAVALYFHALADSFWALLLVRAFAGAAGGMLSGGAVAYVGDYFPYERRGWANGWVMSGIAFGQILAIPMGKLMAASLGFRWPFIAFAITMSLAVLIIWRYVPQPDVAFTKERLTLKTAMSNYAELLKNREVIAASASFFLMFSSIGMYLVFLPTWLEEHIGLIDRDIALMFLIGGIMNVVTGPMAGKLSDRVGRKPLIITSCAGLSVVMIVTTFVIGQIWIAYLWFAITMVLIAMRISPFQALITAIVPAQQRGVLMSLSIAIGQVGVGIGGGAAGAAYGSLGFFSNTIIAAVAIGLMAWIVHRYFDERPLRDASALSEG